MRTLFELWNAYKSAFQNRPLTGSVRWQVYGGPVGEPALGPISFPHRTSAMPNLLAPIAHHWRDATHIRFGVVTAGVYGDRWKAEASAFNGREPDDERTDFDVWEELNERRPDATNPSTDSDQVQFVSKSEQRFATTTAAWMCERLKIDRNHQRLA